MRPRTEGLANPNVSMVVEPNQDDERDWIQVKSKKKCPFIRKKNCFQDKDTLLVKITPNPLINVTL